MRPKQTDDCGRGLYHPDPLLVTMEELQHLLGCGKTTAFSIVGRREIETVRIGRRRMALLQSAIDYVQRLRDANAMASHIEGSPNA